MNTEMKRRAFLGTIIGTLAAMPFGIRYFRGKKAGLPHHDFAAELQKYQTLVNVPVKSIDGPASLSLPLQPVAGSEWKYLLFSPSHLPNEISQAVGDEPDTFVIREGWGYIDTTPSGQTVILGGDDRSCVCSPSYADERDVAEFALLLHEGKLVPAKEKGTQANPKRDTQFQHLLALKDVPNELALGTKWQSTSGRMKPFAFKTDYEVAGFAEIAGRKTVDIRFSANIPNLAGLPGVSKRKPQKGETMTNSHSGHAYFDLETGLLVRQEVEMTSTVAGVKGMNKALSVDAKFFIQLFNV
jgi:hypothetical protein